MKLKVIVAVVLSALAFAAIAASSSVRVVDGDTINVPRHMVHGLPRDVSVRLYGVNTPELHGQCASEILKAKGAKLYVQGRVSSAKKIVVTYVQRDKYSRVDARVTIDGSDLATDLINGGYGVPYAGEARDPMMWCKTTGENK